MYKITKILKANKVKNKLFCYHAEYCIDH